ncbi:MAG: glutamate racemase [Clostridia bacterium]
MNDLPIAIIDSGVGGIFALKECRKIMPYEKFVYVADSLHAPYGNKKKEEIERVVCTLVEKVLAQRNVKLVVLACNTATAVCIEQLRNRFQIPFVGMEPAFKSAIKDDCKKILVLGTCPTIKFNKNIINAKRSGLIFTRSFKNLAYQIEKNWENDQFWKGYFNKKFSECEIAECDAIVLGCSHYVLIKKHLKNLFKKDVKFYLSDLPVANRCKALLCDLSLETDNKKEIRSVDVYLTRFDTELISSIVDLI